MTSKMTSHGDVTLQFNPANGDKLMSPDGTQHFLPCDVCDEPAWQHLDVVSFMCPECRAWLDKKTIPTTRRTRR